MRPLDQYVLGLCAVCSVPAALVGVLWLVKHLWLAL